MNSNFIVYAAVHGLLAKKSENLIPIAGNWVINTRCTASYCGCSNSPRSHMLYLFGTEPLSHTLPL